jgi:hypothetical protein
MSVLDKYIYHYNEFASFETEQISNIVSTNLLNIDSLNLNSINQLSSMYTELKKTIKKESDLTAIDQIIYILSKIIENHGLGKLTKVGIEKLPYGLDEVLKIDPIIYREMTPTGVIKNHEGNKLSGFADEDLENLMPGVELTNDAIIGALINAIKELKEEITQLKKQESRVIVISK